MSSPSLSDHSLPPSPLPEAEPDQPLKDLDELSATPVEDPGEDMDDLSDNDSILSDVDEAQFEDFDPNQIAIEERPAIAVDEDNVKLLGRHKRKRVEGEVVGEKTKKKNKGAKREKPKKARKKDSDDDDDFSGGQELEGKRVRKKKAFAEGGEKVRKEKTKPRQAEPEDEEQLDPEERELVFWEDLMALVDADMVYLCRSKTCPRQSHGRCAQESYKAPPQSRRSRTLTI